MIHSRLMRKILMGLNNTKCSEYSLFLPTLRTYELKKCLKLLILFPVAIK